MYSAITRRRWRATFVLSCTLVPLGGCSTVTAIVTSKYVTGASAVSYFVSGKSVSDHTLSAITRLNCSVVSAVVSGERTICEQLDSPVLDDEFRGVIAKFSVNPSNTSVTNQAGYPPPNDLEVPPSLVLEPLFSPHGARH